MVGIYIYIYIFTATTTDLLMSIETREHILEGILMGDVGVLPGYLRGRNFSCLWMS